MATILAYTSPALGHLLPMSALMVELAGRGHTVHVRTLSAGLDTARHLGFVAEPIDPRIEAIQIDDWQATNPRGSAGRSALPPSIAAPSTRSTDLADAVRQADPDALLIDVTAGALNRWPIRGPSRGRVSRRTHVPLRADGVPPFGLGLPPRTGPMGRIRDAAVRAAVVGPPEDHAAADQPSSREGGCLAGGFDGRVPAPGPTDTAGERQAVPIPATEWGDAVQMIGPCVLDSGRRGRA